MKKQLLYPISLLLAVPVSGATESPLMIPEFYSRNISADGSVIGSYTDAGTSLYYVATGDRIEFQSLGLGNGNCISDDGSVIVGISEEGGPVVVFNKKLADVSAVTEAYPAANFHGVSGRGRRVVGVVANPDRSAETTYLPVYIDIDDKGKLSAPVLLPYAKKDWQGLDVQYCNATWVSRDGKTILGQVVDWSGMDMYPILYQEAEDGTWTYSLPTQQYINPDNLPLPEYPGDFELNPPYYGDYMTPAQLADYEEAMDQFWAGLRDEPFPEEFMSAQNATKYDAALENFNAAAAEYNAKVDKYFADKWAIEESSIFFTRGSFSLSPDGKFMALGAEIIVPSENPYVDPTVANPTYLLEVGSTDLKEIKSTEEGIYPLPTDILDDGTLIAATPLTGALPPRTFVLPKGENEYIALEKYLEGKIPTAAAWMKENLVYEVEIGYDPVTMDPIYGDLLMSGFAVVSDSWSVISGGLLAYLYPSAYSFESYLINDDGSGITDAAVDGSPVEVKWYDLNGREVIKPEKGIYIERTTNTDGSVSTSKKAL